MHKTNNELENMYSNIRTNSKSVKISIQQGVSNNL